MKDKIMTLICSVLCLMIFASACTGDVWTTAREAAAPAVMPLVREDPELEPAPPPAVSPTPSPAPTPDPEPPHPFTEEEVVMLAKVIGAEAYIVPSKARQAAVGWCALNRLDDGRFGDTLAEVLTTPYQFAYRENAEVYPEMLDLAEDILCLWAAEKNGDLVMGRTLPSDYLYFEGDGKENHFRKTQNAAQEWDWSLPDPYEEG
jgi:hypothetical protein